MDRTGDRAPGQPVGLWRNGDFLKLWGGETLSQIGSQVTQLALPLLAIVTLNAGPRTVGLLAAAQYAPILLFSLFAGVWLDRHPRRPVLVATNLGRAVLLGLVPALYLLDALSIPVLLLLVFGAGSLTAFFDVAYVSTVPQLVHRDQLVEANAKLEATYSIAEVGGPGLGGILVQTITAPVTILVDAATYLVAAVLNIRIRHRERRPARRRAEASAWAEIGNGLATTLRHPILRPMVLQSAAFNLLAFSVLTLFLVHGIRNLHLSPGTLGVLLATGSVGGILGTVLARPAARRLGTGRTMVWSMAVSSAALGLLPAAQGNTPTVVPLLITGLVLHGLGLGLFNVHSLTVRAILIPAEMLSRVTATYRFISNGTLPLGGLLAGFLGHAVGVRSAMTISVLLLALSCIMFLTSRVRTFETAEARAAAGDEAALTESS